MLDCNCQDDLCKCIPAETIFSKAVFLNVSLHSCIFFHFCVIETTADILRSFSLLSFDCCFHAVNEGREDC